MSIYKTKMVNGVEVELTADEIKELEARDKTWADGEYDRLMANIRQERTDLLMESDWMGMSDLTMSADWKTYRQELRDLTNGLDTEDKVNKVTWPKEPS